MEALTKFGDLQQKEMMLLVACLINRLFDGIENRLSFSTWFLASRLRVH